MSMWYSKEIGDGIQSAKPSEKIKASFFAVFAASGPKSDMACFSRYDTSEKNMVTAYFSPAAASIAKQFNAVPCEKPSNIGLVLLCGTDDARQVLFPGEAPQRK